MWERNLHARISVLHVVNSTSPVNQNNDNMNFADFPERNHLLAENQPEYQTMPVFADVRELPHPKTEEPMPVVWSMTAVLELTDEEIAELARTKKLYYRQMLFGAQFQPIFLSTKDPFVPENKEHWPQE